MKSSKLHTTREDYDGRVFLKIMRGRFIHYKILHQEIKCDEQRIHSARVLVLLTKTLFHFRINTDEIKINTFYLANARIL